MDGTSDGATAWACLLLRSSRGTAAFPCVLLRARLRRCVAAQTSLAFARFAAAVTALLEAAWDAAWAHEESPPLPPRGGESLGDASEGSEDEHSSDELGPDAEPYTAAVRMPNTWRSAEQRSGAARSVAHWEATLAATVVSSAGECREQWRALHYAVFARLQRNVQRSYALSRETRRMRWWSIVKPRLVALHLRTLPVVLSQCVCSGAAFSLGASPDRGLLSSGGGQLLDATALLTPLDASERAELIALESDGRLRSAEVLHARRLAGCRVATTLATALAHADRTSDARARCELVRRVRVLRAVGAEAVALCREWPTELPSPRSNVDGAEDGTTKDSARTKLKRAVERAAPPIVHSFLRSLVRRGREEGRRLSSASGVPTRRRRRRSSQKLRAERAEFDEASAFVAELLAAGDDGESEGGGDASSSASAAPTARDLRAVDEDDDDEDPAVATSTSQLLATAVNVCLACRIQRVRTALGQNGCVAEVTLDAVAGAFAWGGRGDRSATATHLTLGALAVRASETTLLDVRGETTLRASVQSDDAAASGATTRTKTPLRLSAALPTTSAVRVTLAPDAIAKVVTFIKRYSESSAGRMSASAMRQLLQAEAEARGQRLRREVQRWRQQRWELAAARSAELRHRESGSSPLIVGSPRPLVRSVSEQFPGGVIAMLAVELTAPCGFALFLAGGGTSAVVTVARARSRGTIAQCGAAVEEDGDDDSSGGDEGAAASVAATAKTTAATTARASAAPLVALRANATVGGVALSASALQIALLGRWIKEARARRAAPQEKGVLARVLASVLLPPAGGQSALGRTLLRVRSADAKLVLDGDAAAVMLDGRGARFFAVTLKPASSSVRTAASPTLTLRLARHGVELGSRRRVWERANVSALLSLDGASLHDSRPFAQAAPMLTLSPSIAGSSSSSASEVSSGGEDGERQDGNRGDPAPGVVATATMALARTSVRHLNQSSTAARGGQTTASPPRDTNKLAPSSAAFGTALAVETRADISLSLAIGRVTVDGDANGALSLALAANALGDEVAASSVSARVVPEHGGAGSVSIREVSAQREPAVLAAIGELRYTVWGTEEGALDTTLPQFADSSWLDASDAETSEKVRHFCAFAHDAGPGGGGASVLVGASRLVLHRDAVTSGSDRDIALWMRSDLNDNASLRWPVCDLGRLVVARSHRGRGVATRLNAARVAAARDSGAAMLIATASASNARLLARHHGFIATGETITFDDRPDTLFYAVQKYLEPSQRASSDSRARIAVRTRTSAAPSTAWSAPTRLRAALKRAAQTRREVQRGRVGLRDFQLHFSALEAQALWACRALTPTHAGQQRGGVGDCGGGGAAASKEALPSSSATGAANCAALEMVSGALRLSLHCQHKGGQNQAGLHLWIVPARPDRIEFGAPAGVALVLHESTRSFNAARRSMASSAALISGLLSTATRENSGGAPLGAMDGMMGETAAANALSTALAATRAVVVARCAFVGVTKAFVDATRNEAECVSTKRALEITIGAIESDCLQLADVALLLAAVAQLREVARSFKTQRAVAHAASGWSRVRQLLRALVEADAEEKRRGSEGSDRARSRSPSRSPLAKTSATVRRLMTGAALDDAAHDVAIRWGVVAVTLMTRGAIASAASTAPGGGIVGLGAVGRAADHSAFAAAARSNTPSRRSLPLVRVRIRSGAITVESRSRVRKMSARSSSSSTSSSGAAAAGSEREEVKRTARGMPIVRRWSLACELDGVEGYRVRCAAWESIVERWGAVVRVRRRTQRTPPSTRVLQDLEADCAAAAAQADDDPAASPSVLQLYRRVEQALMNVGETSAESVVAMDCARHLQFNFTTASAAMLPRAICEIQSAFAHFERAFSAYRDGAVPTAAAAGKDSSFTGRSSPVVLGKSQRRAHWPFVLINECGAECGVTLQRTDRESGRRYPLVTSRMRKTNGRELHDDAAPACSAPTSRSNGVASAGFAPPPGSGLLRASLLIDGFEEPCSSPRRGARAEYRYDRHDFFEVGLVVAQPTREQRAQRRTLRLAMEGAHTALVRKLDDYGDGVSFDDLSCDSCAAAITWLNTLAQLDAISPPPPLVPIALWTADISHADGAWIVRVGAPLVVRNDTQCLLRVELGAHVFGMSALRSIAAREADNDGGGGGAAVDGEVLRCNELSTTIMKHVVEDDSTTRASPDVSASAAAPLDPLTLVGTAEDFGERSCAAQLTAELELDLNNPSTLAGIADGTIAVPQSPVDALERVFEALRQRWARGALPGFPGLIGEKARDVRRDALTHAVRLLAARCATMLPSVARKALAAAPPVTLLPGEQMRIPLALGRRWALRLSKGASGDKSGSAVAAHAPTSQWITWEDVDFTTDGGATTLLPLDQNDRNAAAVAVGQRGGKAEGVVVCCGASHRRVEEGGRQRGRGRLTLSVSAPLVLTNLLALPLRWRLAARLGAPEVARRAAARAVGAIDVAVLAALGAKVGAAKAVERCAAAVAAATESSEIEAAVQRLVDVTAATEGAAEGTAVAGGNGDTPGDAMGPGSKKITVADASGSNRWSFASLWGGGGASSSGGGARTPAPLRASAGSSRTGSTSSSSATDAAAASAKPVHPTVAGDANLASLRIVAGSERCGAVHDVLMEDELVAREREQGGGSDDTYVAGKDFGDNDASLHLAAGATIELFELALRRSDGIYFSIASGVEQQAPHQQRWSKWIALGNIEGRRRFTVPGPLSTVPSAHRAITPRWAPTTLLLDERSVHSGNDDAAPSIAGVMASDRKQWHATIFAQFWCVNSTLSPLCFSAAADLEDKRTTCVSASTSGSSAVPSSSNAGLSPRQAVGGGGVTMLTAAAEGADASCVLRVGAWSEWSEPLSLHRGEHPFPFTVRGDASGAMHAMRNEAAMAKAAENGSEARATMLKPLVQGRFDFAVTVGDVANVAALAGLTRAVWFFPRFAFVAMRRPHAGASSRTTTSAELSLYVRQAGSTSAGGDDVGDVQSAVHVRWGESEADATPFHWSDCDLLATRGDSDGARYIQICAVENDKGDGAENGAAQRQWSGPIDVGLLAARRVAGIVVKVKVLREGGEASSMIFVHVSVAQNARGGIVITLRFGGGLLSNARAEGDREGEVADQLPLLRVVNTLVEAQLVYRQHAHSATAELLRVAKSGSLPYGALQLCPSETAPPLTVTRWTWSEHAPVIADAVLHSLTPPPLSALFDYGDGVGSAATAAQLAAAVAAGAAATSSGGSSGGGGEARLLEVRIGECSEVVRLDIGAMLRAGGGRVAVQALLSQDEAIRRGVASDAGTVAGWGRRRNEATTKDTGGNGGNVGEVVDAEEIDEKEGEDVGGEGPPPLRYGDALLFRFALDERPWRAIGDASGSTTLLAGRTAAYARGGAAEESDLRRDAVVLEHGAPSCTLGGTALERARREEVMIAARSSVGGAADAEHIAEFGDHSFTPTGAVGRAVRYGDCVWVRLLQPPANAEGAAAASPVEAKGEPETTRDVQPAMKEAEEEDDEDEERAASAASLSAEAEEGGSGADERAAAISAAQSPPPPNSVVKGPSLADVGGHGLFMTTFTTTYGVQWKSEKRSEPAHSQSLWRVRGGPRGTYARAGAPFWLESRYYSTERYPARFRSCFAVATTTSSTATEEIICGSGIAASVAESGAAHTLVSLPTLRTCEAAEQLKLVAAGAAKTRGEKRSSGGAMKLDGGVAGVRQAVVSTARKLKKTQAGGPVAGVELSTASEWAAHPPETTVAKNAPSLGAAAVHPPDDSDSDDKTAASEVVSEHERAATSVARDAASGRRRALRRMVGDIRGRMVVSVSQNDVLGRDESAPDATSAIAASAASAATGATQPVRRRWHSMGRSGVLRRAACFNGEDAIDWLIADGTATAREEAALLVDLLHSRDGLIERVDDDANRRRTVTHSIGHARASASAGLSGSKAAAFAVAARMEAERERVLSVDSAHAVFALTMVPLPASSGSARADSYPLVSIVDDAVAATARAAAAKLKQCWLVATTVCRLPLAAEEETEEPAAAAALGAEGEVTPLLDALDSPPPSAVDVAAAAAVSEGKTSDTPDVVVLMSSDDAAAALAAKEGDAVAVALLGAKRAALVAAERGAARLVWATVELVIEAGARPSLTVRRAFSGGELSSNAADGALPAAAAAAASGAKTATPSKKEQNVNTGKAALLAPSPASALTPSVKRAAATALCVGARVVIVGVSGSEKNKYVIVGDGSDSRGIAGEHHRVVLNEARGTIVSSVATPKQGARKRLATSPPVGDEGGASAATGATTGAAAAATASGGHRWRVVLDIAFGDQQQTQKQSSSSSSSIVSVDEKHLRRVATVEIDVELRGGVSLSLFDCAPGAVAEEFLHARIDGARASLRMLGGGGGGVGNSGDGDNQLASENVVWFDASARHVQIDQMLARASYPVVLQPRPLAALQANQKKRIEQRLAALADAATRLKALGERASREASMRAPFDPSLIAQGSVRTPMTSREKRELRNLEGRNLPKEYARLRSELRSLVGPPCVVVALSFNANSLKKDEGGEDEGAVQPTVLALRHVEVCAQCFDVCVEEAVLWRLHRFRLAYDAAKRALERSASRDIAAADANARRASATTIASAAARSVLGLAAKEERQPATSLPSAFGLPRSVPVSDAALFQWLREHQEVQVVPSAPADGSAASAAATHRRPHPSGADAALPGAGGSGGGGGGVRLEIDQLIVHNGSVRLSYERADAATWRRWEAQQQRAAAVDAENDRLAREAESNLAGGGGRRSSNRHAAGGGSRGDTATTSTTPSVTLARTPWWLVGLDDGEVRLSGFAMADVNTPVPALMKALAAHYIAQLQRSNNVAGVLVAATPLHPLRALGGALFDVLVAPTGGLRVSSAEFGFRVRDGMQSAWWAVVFSTTMTLSNLLQGGADWISPLALDDEWQLERANHDAVVTQRASVDSRSGGGGGGGGAGSGVSGSGGVGGGRHTRTQSQAVMTLNAAAVDGTSPTQQRSLQLLNAAKQGAWKLGHGLWGSLPGPIVQMYTRGVEGASGAAAAGVRGAVGLVPKVATAVIDALNVPLSEVARHASMEELPREKQRLRLARLLRGSPGDARLVVPLSTVHPYLPDLAAFAPKGRCVNRFSCFFLSLFLRVCLFRYRVLTTCLL